MHETYLSDLQQNKLNQLIKKIIK